MLKKLGRTAVPGVFKWKIWVKLPHKTVHTHVELTEVQAQKMYTELLEQKARAVVSLPFSGALGVHTLGEAVPKYEQELLKSGYNADHTKQVTFTLSLLRDLLKDEFPLASLNREHVRAWRDKRQGREYRGETPSARTINKGLAHLSAFFSWCCREGWMENNPAQYATRVKEVSPEMKILHWSDFRRFADAAWEERPDFGLLVEILGETGARIDEVMRAKVGEVDVGRKVWTKVVKPGKTVVIDAEEWVLYAAQGRKVDEPLCPSLGGSHFEYHVVKRLFTKVREAAGIGAAITPHWLRHGRACWDLNEGKSVWQVKTKLAHSTVLVTERYVRASELLRREEVESGVVEQHRRELRVVLCCDQGVFPSISQLYTGKHSKPSCDAKPLKEKEVS
jgi:integrase